MKLPEDKKTRNQVFIMIAIGVVAAIYGLFALVLQPFSAKKKSIRGNIAKLTEDIRRANAEIDKKDKDERSNREVAGRIDAASEKHFLKPRLGNYILAATDILDAAAKEAGVTFTTVKEIGIGDVIRSGSSKIIPPIRGYTARVTLQGGYQDLTRILRVIETNNPYLFITSVTIVGQPKQAPNIHSMTFDIQWPVWGDEAIPIRIRAQLEADDDSTKEQPHGGTAQ